MAAAVVAVGQSATRRSSRPVSGRAQRTKRPGGPRKFGTKVTFTLDQAASVRFTVQRPRHGRGKHGEATRPPEERQARKCTRFVTLRGVSRSPGVAGTNTFHFTGRLNGKRLAPGKYRLVATPKANGEIGNKATAGFTIIP